MVPLVCAWGAVNLVGEWVGHEAPIEVDSLWSSFEIDAPATASLLLLVIAKVSIVEWSVSSFECVRSANAGCGLIADEDVSADVSWLGCSGGVVSDAAVIEFHLLDGLSRSILNMASTLYTVGGAVHGLDVSPNENSCWSWLGELSCNVAVCGRVVAGRCYAAA